MENKLKAILDDIPEAYQTEVATAPSAQPPGATPLERGAWKTQRLGLLRQLAAQISNLQDAKQDTRQLAFEVAVIKRELLDQADNMEQLQHIRTLKDNFARCVPIAEANLTTCLLYTSPSPRD